MKLHCNPKSIVLIASLALTSSVIAQSQPQFISGAQVRTAEDPSGTYISLFGGASVDQRADSYSNTFSGGSFDGDIGAMAGGKIGYDLDRKEFDAFWGGKLGIITALELEGFYLDNSHDVGGGSADLESLFFGLNGVLKFDFDSIVQPYIGAGIGGAYMMYEQGAFEDSDVFFSWQLFNGLEFDVGRGWGIFVEHKWISVVDMEYNNLGTTISSDWYHQNTVSGGVKYKF